MKNDLYSALGNKVRITLVKCLSSKPKNVTQLIENCQLAQSAVSQHLGKLKKAGLLKTSKKGKEVWYALKHSQTAKVAQLLTVLEKKLS